MVITFTLMHVETLIIARGENSFFTLVSMLAKTLSFRGVEWQFPRSIAMFTDGF